MYKNGVLVSSGVTLCVTGVTKNANNAKEVSVSFAPFSATPFNGTTDVLSLKILTRIGTNVSGTFCGGHSNAAGLRLYFDAGNRPARFDATIVQNTDTVAPTITATVTPAPNAAGWIFDPTVNFTCFDAGSGIASCSGPVTVSTETSGEVVVGTAIDSAGNTATTTVTIKLDKSPPVIASTVTPEPNAAQWNNSDPTVTFSCSDETSGTRFLHRTGDDYHRNCGTGCRGKHYRQSGKLSHHVCNGEAGQDAPKHNGRSDTHPECRGMESLRSHRHLYVF